MKLLSLNIWGGKAFDPLMSFLDKKAGDVDIFCFQEVFKSPLNKISRGTKVNIYDDLLKVFKEYQVFFGPVQDGFDNEGSVDFEVSCGQATFIKNTIQVKSSENIMLCGERNSAEPDKSITIPPSMLCTRIANVDKDYIICNIHGVAYPGTKLDTKERIEQSNKIKNFIKKDAGSPTILAGDFNLMPETKSVNILEEDFENLIKKFKITNTRSKLSPYANSENPQRFADYTFVSPDVLVKNFEVLEDQVSDHLPMYLEFE